ncbi:MAG: multicopper oxidase domain-containing protein [Acidimicrobiia bacterium]|nr:multicopper oxidase domain-containing protein [Acidimicrobiia bacterium]MDH4308269.1 multicopper oxidase domain-containing protein [Acidimicrobiia bacterium]
MTKGQVMQTRREFLKNTALGSAAVLVAPGIMMKMGSGGVPFLFQIPGGSLDPHAVTKYAMPLVKPPVMPLSKGSNRNRDKYRIGVRQFDQQILPSPLPKTTVWSYASRDFPGTLNYPAFTVEATWNKPVQVIWSNDLVDAAGGFLPHLLPIDQTLHWANPPGGAATRDRRGTDPSPYVGPVPIVTHVHGAHTTEDSDGYAEAWYLPNAQNIPAGYATTGTFYDYFNTKYAHDWAPGTASFKYPNDQPASTLWYHDHTLGMTRANVYAGPAGFWLIRGGPNDMELGFVAPGVGDDPFGSYTEIPIVIQDRSFNENGSLFYPDNRAFFEGLDSGQLQIPFIPDPACDGLRSDVSPIWNPEFFGNVMVVNGSAWPYLEVEQRRYRFRLLNGCNSRFLYLCFDNGQPIHQIGGDQGFLPVPVEQTELLLAPAERADVIVDFTSVPTGTELILTNLGPDEPFGGGIPGVDFEPADPGTTGQVMQFRVIERSGADNSVLPVTLPAAPMPGPASVTRRLSLNELESESVRVSELDGSVVLDCADGEVFGPIAALLGTIDGNGAAVPLEWGQAITENPALGSTEVWEFHNFTADAHPIHIHQTHFEVVGRGTDGTTPPEPSETGYKDTVIAYPGEVTRVKALYDLPGFYVWHCHIVEHEDNEMMRPFHVGPIPGDAPAG